ncbi:MAG TPA: hypothetical protein PJ990_11055, partial [Saprospiraceae bacterium]|nr:hypothetical protein [Saprospiraceae bacterium]
MYSRTVVQTVSQSTPTPSAMRLYQCHHHKIINQCNDVKLLYLSKGTNATGVAYRNAITKIIAPDAHQPHDEGKTYSASRYWSRFYDILGDYKTNKAAYEAVESEWNEVGVEMFPPYEAFRA